MRRCSARPPSRSCWSAPATPRSTIWNFPGFLKESLRTDLQTTAVEAKGPFYAMEQFLAGQKLADPEITTVIWEFPARTLLAEKPVTSGWQVAANQFF